MILLGIVGTPAAGKSTVAKILAEWGAEWINADLIARECLNSVDVIAKLTDRFGADVLLDSGQVNRAKIAECVFGDEPHHKAALHDLESFVHPETRIMIHQRIVAAARSRCQIALLDVPLLFESQWDLVCDAIWCVDASVAVRQIRAAQRGWDDDELAKRESHQIPIETKIRLSNSVMRNDSTLEALRQNLRLRWDLLVRIEAHRQSNTTLKGGLASEAASSEGTLVPGETGFTRETGPHCVSDWPTGHGDAKT